VHPRQTQAKARAGWGVRDVDHHSHQYRLASDFLGRFGPAPETLKKNARQRPERLLAGSITGAGRTACTPICFSPDVPWWGWAVSWKRCFDDLILLPDGKRLVTLQDAGDSGSGRVIYSRRPE
jgi:hypothetical protein